MKSILTIIIIVTVNITLHGQHHLGLKINGGISKISNSLKPSYSTNKLHLPPSGQFGLFYNYDLGDKSILGVELLYLAIEDKNKTAYNYTSNGNVIGHHYNTILKHISYLSLPIYYGLKVNDLTINAGFQFSYAIISGGIGKTELAWKEEFQMYDYKFGPLEIDRIDYGPRAGAIYNLTDKFAIEGLLYYGIHNIFAWKMIDWTWKIRQATVGIRYSFSTR